MKKDPNPICRQPWLGSVAAIVVLAWMCACEGMTTLKERLQGEGRKGSLATEKAQLTEPALQDEAKAPPKEAAPFSHTATLEVTVVPPRGISVRIDGKRVADSSPVVVTALSSGRHVLVVRAMGFYEVTLPLDVAPGQHLRVPVALRRRQPSDVAPNGLEALPADRPTADGPTAPAETNRPQKAQPNRPAHLESLPQGARAMILSVALDPAGPVLADGELAQLGELRLGHGTGRIDIANASLRYRIHPGHVLELTVPHDGAAWFRDGSQVKSASLLRLEGQPMQLRRIDAQGAWQATLHRLE